MRTKTKIGNNIINWWWTTQDNTHARTRTLRSWKSYPPNMNESDIFSRARALPKAMPTENNELPKSTRYEIWRKKKRANDDKQTQRPTPQTNSVSSINGFSLNTDSHHDECWTEESAQFGSNVSIFSEQFLRRRSHRKGVSRISQWEDWWTPSTSSHALPLLISIFAFVSCKCFSNTVTLCANLVDCVKYTSECGLPNCRGNTFVGNRCLCAIAR